VDVLQARAVRGLLHLDDERFETGFHAEDPPVDSPALLLGLQDLRLGSVCSHPEAGQNIGNQQHAEDQEAEQPERMR
jgi:hypothetical protein